MGAFPSSCPNGYHYVTGRGCVPNQAINDNGGAFASPVLDQNSNNMLPTAHQPFEQHSPLGSLAAFKGIHSCHSTHTILDLHLLFEMFHQQATC